jgi:hypothetical protein
MDGDLETGVVDTLSFFMANRWCVCFLSMIPSRGVINEEVR